MDKPVVAECSALHHQYGTTPALAGIDLALRGGRVTALLGPNGAGKTTLIHLLLGVLPIQQGRIELFGSLVPGQRGAQQRIGVMLQSKGVQGNLTVAELLALFASFYPEPDSQIGLLDELGLADLADRRFDRLSGGQKQRVLFALAVIGRPDWLILDEPTTGLDPGARRILWRAIESRRRAGVSILLCTHFMDEAQKLADYVIVLDHGRILDQGTPDEVRRRVPSDRIRVRTALKPERIRTMPAVQNVTTSDERTEILSRNGTETVRALLAADASLDELEVAGADLEAAFLALTCIDADEQEAA
ncbi:ABC transporter ATP-binding protein [Wenzhouxiangella sp. XN201]|uniref:ABC transporter ATP-binding protein n=1 Tax=Wenzhouxiangella sp. XN201 TaxID=2710755 RepID=UPI0013C8820A|nr:ABC transporter ATP-binding protein [Wenzhouxiangella sp. XN201]NEZ04389.1 ABC transporter ATP-binding protein [Wenzhouxiangella sp. XN201]